MSSYFRHCVTYIGTMLLPLVLVASTVGCAPTGADPDSEDLAGADETAASSDQGLYGSIPVGSTLRANTGVNLRTGASTSQSILHVVPDGGQVTVQDSNPVNGFYKVKHNGTVGWSYGAYYDLEAVADDGGDAGDAGDDAGDDESSGSPRSSAISRAKKAMGFSYWWGHGRFKDEGVSNGGAGSCSGSCPSCSHSGSYGGDCSGLAAKVWQVPSSNTSLTTDSHPYSTADFNSNTSQWSTVSRDSLREADAMVYRSGGSGHIFVYGSGDGWGSPYAYECKGCSYGCVEGYRSASSAYHGIRRSGY